MKKKVLNKVVVAVVSSAIIGGIGLNSSAILGINGTAGVVAEAAVETRAGDTVNVSTIKEFEAALNNVRVTTINVTQSIKMTRNITNIPARNVEIVGNKDQGVKIDSNKYSIYGKQSTRKAADAGLNNVFAIINADIEGAQDVGRFFTGGSGNGPSSFGWDIFAKDVTYTGARFVHLTEGKLTFDGTNDIKTRAENAWVHDLEFLPGSTYNGQAAMKDHGQFSAFYFNGRTIDGKTTGQVNIGKDAKVDLVISPQSDVNHYYPAFYDKVYQVNVGEGAKLNVDAAGVAFQFIPRSDYANIPSLNLDKNSNVKFNGRGGGKYQTVKLQQYGAQINQEQGSELYIDGFSERGVIESIYEYANFNMLGAKQLHIANAMPNAPLFRGDRTFVKGADINEIKTWNRDGGNYPDTEIKDKFTTQGMFITYVGLGGDAYFNDRSAEVFSRNNDVKEQFQMGDYGKVEFYGGGGGNGGN
jgi:hypothetical protein